MPPACRLRYWPFLVAREVLGRAPLAGSSYPLCLALLSRVSQGSVEFVRKHWALPSAPTRIPRAAVRGRVQTAPGCELRPGCVGRCRWRQSGGPCPRLAPQTQPSWGHGQWGRSGPGGSALEQRGGGGRWVRPRPAASTAHASAPRARAWSQGLVSGSASVHTATERQRHPPRVPSSVKWGDESTV